MADQLPAEFDEAFAEFNPSLPDDVTHNPKVNRFSNLNPISGFQRWVVKNVFDSQPKKRRSYMKKYGYELSPDGESYRPIGLKTDFIPIEDTTEVPVGAKGELGGLAPGGFGRGDARNKFQWIANLATKEGATEALQDLGDATWDIAVSGPLQTIGGMIGGGAAAGLAAAPAAGATAATGGAAAPAAASGIGLASILGTMAGSAGGEAISESLKSAIGDTLLDEKVPLDMEEYLSRVAVAGTLGGLAKGGDKLIRKMGLNSAESYKKAIDEVLNRKLGNTPASQKIVEDMFAHPEKYHPDAVKGAGDRLAEIRHKMLGTSVENPKSVKDMRSGILKDKIAPVHDMAELEIEKLAKNREADFTVDELIEELQRRTKPLREEAFYAGHGETGKEALEFMNAKIAELKNTFRVDSPTELSAMLGGESAEEFRDLNFKEARDFLKTIQEATFEKGGRTHKNPLVANMARGLRETVDVKAGELGSDLPELMAKQHQMLNADRALKSVLTPSMIQKAYLGPAGNTERKVVRDVIKQFDDTMGSNMSEAMETAQFQTAVEQLFDNPKQFNQSFIDVMREGLAGGAQGSARIFPAAAAVKSATDASVIGPATVTAGLVGARRAAKTASAFKSPEVLIKTIEKTNRKLSDLAQDPFVLEVSLAPWRYPKRVVQGIAQRPLTAAAATATGGLVRPRPGPLPPEAPPPETAGQGGGPGPVVGPPAQAATLPEEFDEAFKDFNPDLGLSP